MCPLLAARLTTEKEAKATEDRLRFASSAWDKHKIKDVRSPITPVEISASRAAGRRVHVMDEEVGTRLVLKRDEDESDSSSANDSDGCSSDEDKEAMPAELLCGLRKAKLNALTHEAPAYTSKLRSPPPKTRRSLYTQ